MNRWLIHATHENSTGFVFSHHYVVIIIIIIAELTKAQTYTEEGNPDPAIYTDQGWKERVGMNS